MINDHRPYRLKKFYLWLEQRYTEHFIRPQLASLGNGHHMMKPWHMSIHGAHIRIGENVHIVNASDRKVSFSTWNFESHQGHIEIGNNCLVCPGVRLDSASKLSIGDNCMLAAGAYITDADWHDIYDRTLTIGATAPVTLMENVWIGDGATICKGVTIGRNSVIGAGSVVAGDIPENVIAAGNTARVIKPLDPAREITTRAALFADREKLMKEMDNIDRYVLTRNGWLGWIRSLIAPRQGD